MLILQRKRGESFVIGGQVTVTLLSVRPDGRVRLGVEAPPTVEVWRSELLPLVCQGCYQSPCICERPADER